MSNFGNIYSNIKKGSLNTRNVIDNITQLSKNPDAILGIGEEVLQGAINGGFDGALGSLKRSLTRGGDIERLKAKIGSGGGMARTNRWVVQFGLPNHSSMTPFRPAAESLALFCQTCSLPTKALSTAEAYYHRRPVKVPYVQTTEDVSFSFLVTNDYLLKSLFDTWIDIPIDQENNTARYKNEYVTDITITTLDIQNNELYSVTLEDAYPISITSVDLSQANDEIVSITVSITFSNIKTISKSSSRRSIFGIQLPNTFPKLPIKLPI